MHLADLADARARIWPNSPAVRDARIALNNAELAVYVRHVAGALHRRGLGPGDTLALRLGNRVETILLVLAAWRLGSAVTPVSPLLDLSHTTQRLRGSAARLAVVEDEEARAGVDTEIPVLLLQEVLGGDPGPFALPRRVAHAGTPALVLPADGTHGRVVVTHDRLAGALHGFIDTFDLSTADHSLLVLPLSDIDGLVRGSLGVLRAGGQVSIAEPFSGEGFLANVRRLRPTYFAASQAEYERLSAVSRDVPHDTSSLRFATAGSAPLAARARASFEHRFGVPVREDARELVGASAA